MIYVILVIVIVLLVSYIAMQNAKLFKISNDINKITSGNFNQRIRLQNHNSAFSELMKSLNSLVDKFQKILIQNQKYEEDKKRMISNISHDLRTPLTSLLGYVEFIKDGKLSNDEKKEYIQIISSKGNDLKKLLEEFFQLSKIDSNDITLNIKKINISEIVRQNIILFMNDFQKLGIEPEVNMSDKDSYAMGDESAAGRIVRNLISNSLKYGSTGKFLGISVREDTRSVFVDVCDKGKGIGKDDIGHIFDRLYTAEKSRSRKLQGSGLGLTIVKKLTEKQNGNITVISEPYIKTVFTFSLPKK